MKYKNAIPFIALLFISFITNDLLGGDIDVEFTDAESTKISRLINTLHPDSVDTFYELYDEWQISTQVPEIQASSNPERYKTDAYDDFEEYTRGLGTAYIGLIADFFQDHYQGVNYFLLLDIVNKDYYSLLDDAKEMWNTPVYDEDGDRLTYTKLSQGNIYFKLILEHIYVQNQEVIFEQVDYCEIDPWIGNEYADDAYNLALREIFEDSTHAFRSFTEVPQTLVKKYLGLLSAVYRDDSPSRDSVFNLYGVHVFPDMMNAGIAVIADSATNWTIEFLADSTQSGNDEFDAVLRSWGFTLDYFFHHDGNAFIVLETEQQLNVLPLLDRLSNIEGVSTAEPTYPISGDGNDIRVTNAGDVTTLSFSVGWGDCPAGCISRHEWIFKITNCEAIFTGIRGENIASTIDQLMPKPQHETSDESFKIYPNPTSGSFTMLTAHSVSRLRLNIYTIDGLAVKSIILGSMQERINIQQLPPGLYIVELVSANLRRHKTLIVSEH